MPSKKSKKTVARVDWYAVASWIIGVIGPLFVIFTKKDNEFAVSHAKQSIVLDITYIIVALVVVVGTFMIGLLGNTVTTPTGLLLYNLLYKLGFIVFIITLIPLPLLIVATHLWGTWKAYKGESFSVPLILNLTEKIGW